MKGKKIRTKEPSQSFRELSFHILVRVFPEDKFTDKATADCNQVLIAKKKRRKNAKPQKSHAKQDHFLSYEFQYMILFWQLSRKV